MGFLDRLHAPAALEQKASAVGVLVSTGVAGQSLSPQDKPEKFADEGYRKNVVVYRSIDLIARSAAGVAWKLFAQQGQDRREIEDHPLLDLIERPNVLQGRSEFIEALVGFFKIAGNSYVEMVAPIGKAPRELWTLRPDRMRVVAGREGVPMAYEYRKGIGQAIRWDFDPRTGQSEVLHFKSFNPLDDWYGLSPLAAAAYEIDTHNSSRRWNKKLLDNEARPSGLLQMRVMRSGTGEAVANLDDTQRERLRADLEERFAGAQNAGRPLVLEGGLEWKQISLSPRDMDFLESRHTTARDIAQALGVPPMLLGIPGDNTYSNMREARLAFWEETVVPLLTHLTDEFNRWLVPRFGQGIFLEPDLDDVPALTLRRERKFEMLQQADFMTLNEKRREVGFDDIEGGDVILQPATMVPLGSEPPELAPQDPGTPEERRARFQLAYGGN